MKRTLFSILLLAASAAHAACLPAEAGGTGGPLQKKVVDDGTLYAWSCPGEAPVAFGAPASWFNHAPPRMTLAQELGWLQMNVGMSRDPEFRRADAKALLNAPKVAQ